MEILTAAILLISCVTVGICGIFIARNRSGINKHSRQHIKDIQADMKYLADSKKEAAQEYRKEIQSLKGSINKMKQGTTITDNDMKNSGFGDIILQLIPTKYRAIGKTLIPQIEEAVKKDPTLIEKVYEKIKTANSPGTSTTENQTANTL
jgi:hypothetical protein